MAAAFLQGPGMTPPMPQPSPRRGIAVNPVLAATAPLAAPPQPLGAPDRSELMKYLLARPKTPDPLSPAEGFVDMLNTGLEGYLAGKAIRDEKRTKAADNTTRATSMIDLLFEGQPQGPETEDKKRKAMAAMINGADADTIMEIFGLGPQGETWADEARHGMPGQRSPEGEWKPYPVMAGSTTDEITNFKFYRDQGGQESFDEWMATKASGASVDKYGLNILYGHEADGSTVPLQAAQSGGLERAAMPEGVTLESGFEKIDTPQGVYLIDRATRQIIPNSFIPKDVSGSATQAAVGAAEGKRIASLPKVEQQAAIMLGTLDALVKHPGFSYAVGWQGNPVIEKAQRLGGAGTDVAGFYSLFDQISGQAFLQAFESIKGGGQITEVEGQKATQAITRLRVDLKEEEFKNAVAEMQEIINRGLDRARRGVMVIEDGTEHGREVPIPEDSKDGDEDAFAPPVTEEDIQFTMEKYGVSREEVLRRLGASDAP